jgi:hypothetical protein
LRYGDTIPQAPLPALIDIPNPRNTLHKSRIAEEVRRKLAHQLQRCMVRGVYAMKRAAVRVQNRLKKYVIAGLRQRLEGLIPTLVE